jgi:hypothetical protein
MIVDGEYHDGVTAESALEILHGLSPAQEMAETGRREDAS